MTTEPTPASSGLAGHAEDAVPLVRVVRGEPSAEELAALTVVVAALSRRPPRPRPVPVGAWGDVATGHRRPLRPGTGGWRTARWTS